VAIVVLAFLQSWRATLIPLIAVPVAIVGTFSVMLGMGFSLNNLSLFGLVLAIGIVWTTPSWLWKQLNIIWSMDCLPKRQLAKRWGR
jgi:hypothetical protein